MSSAEGTIVIDGVRNDSSGKLAVAKLWLGAFLPMAALVVLFAAAFHYSRTETERAIHEGTEQQRVLKREELAAHRVQAIAADLMFLADEAGLHLNEANQQHTFAAELQLFSRRNKQYSEICLLDAEGRDQLSIKSELGKQSVPAKPGPDEWPHGVPKEITRLDKGEVHVSPIQTPLITFAAPVYDAGNRKLGSVVIKYAAENLIGEMKSATPAAPGNDMLLAADGSWIYVSEQAEGGLNQAAKAGRRFSELFPSAWQAIRSGESGHFRTDQGLFTYATIYPSLEALEDSIDLKGWQPGKLPAQAASPNAWKIISFISADVESVDSLRLLYGLLPFYGGLLVLMGGGAWLWASKSIRHREAEARLVQEQMVRIQITRGAELARVTLQSIGDAVFTSDVLGRVAYLNPVAERLTGWSNAEAQGQPFTQVCKIVHEATREPLACPVQKALREGVVVELSGDIILIRRDGEELDIQDTAAPIRDLEDRIIGAVLVAQDVTARRKTERQLQRSNEELREVVRERNQSNKLLRQSEERFRIAFRASPDIISISRLSDSLLIDVNQAFLDFFGYQRDEVIGRTSLELNMWVEADDGSRFFHTLLAKGNLYDQEIACRTKSGEIRLALFSAELVEIDDKPYMLAVSRDITERKRMEEMLREQKEYLHAVVDNVVDGIITIDGQGIIETFNPAACRIFGYQQAEMIGHNISMLMPEPDRSEHDSYIQNYRKSGKAKVIGIGREVVGVRKDGTTFAMDLAVSVVKLDDKQRFVGIVRDITERKEAEQKMAFLAQYDQLTGLANRSLFNDHLRQAIARAKRNGHKLALMFLDMDRFKAINDSHGHDAGDRLLKEVARRLKGCVRDSDVVARLGGDEFTVIMEGFDLDEDAVRAAQGIIDGMGKPFSINGHELVVTVSIGIALFPQSGDDAETLLRHADIAMYRIKECGRNAYGFYQDGAAGECPVDEVKQ